MTDRQTVQNFCVQVSQEGLSSLKTLNRARCYVQTSSLQFVAYTKQNVLPKMCSRPEFPRGSTKRKSQPQQTRLKKHSAANLVNFQLEKELMKYVTDSRKDSYASSTEMLCAKALAIVRHACDCQQQYRAAIPMKTSSEDVRS